MNILDFDFEIYGAGFEKSAIICNLYRYIININDEEAKEEILKRISKLIILENIMYDILDLKTVDMYLEEIPKPVDEDIPELYRYYQKLTNRKMKLLGGEEAEVDNYSVYSIISGIIAINTYISMYKKIIEMQTNNESDEIFLNTLIEYFNNLKYNYLSFISYAEEYAVKYNYDFDKIPPINLEELPTKIKLWIDIIGNTLLNSAKEYIDDLMQYQDSEKNVSNIFETLFELTALEEIAKMLGEMEILKLISFYFNKYKVQDNSLEQAGIKRILNKRKNELFE